MLLEPVELMYTKEMPDGGYACPGAWRILKIELAPGLAIRFIDVGHLLGSSSIEINGH